MKESWRDRKDKHVRLVGHCETIRSAIKERLNEKLDPIMLGTECLDSGEAVSTILEIAIACEVLSSTLLKAAEDISGSDEEKRMIDWMKKDQKFYETYTEMTAQGISRKYNVTKRFRFFMPAGEA
tara:strand:+ start:688 stop:1062 length:375 start_codon:yes stop_codon:yes gene_type:complete